MPGRRDFYLGTYGTAASRAKNDRRIAEWIAASRRLPVDPDAVTVAEIAAAFRKLARSYYSPGSGPRRSASPAAEEIRTKIAGVTA